MEADDEVGVDSEEVKVNRSPEVSFESVKRLSTSALAALLPFFDFCAVWGHNGICASKKSIVNCEFRGVTDCREENAPMGETWRLRNVAARDVSKVLGERWRGLALAKEKRVAIVEDDEDDELLDAERALLAGAKQGQTAYEPPWERREPARTVAGLHVEVHCFMLAPLDCS